jgi:hypothetical protein
VLFGELRRQFARLLVPAGTAQGLYLMDAHE